MIRRVGDVAAGGVIRDSCLSARSSKHVVVRVVRLRLRLQSRRIAGLQEAGSADPSRGRPVRTHHPPPTTTRETRTTHWPLGAAPDRSGRWPLRRRRRTTRSCLRHPGTRHRRARTCRWRPASHGLGPASCQLPVGAAAARCRMPDCAQCGSPTSFRGARCPSHHPAYHVGLTAPGHWATVRPACAASWLTY